MQNGDGATSVVRDGHMHVEKKKRKKVQVLDRCYLWIQALKE